MFLILWRTGWLTFAVSLPFHCLDTGVVQHSRWGIFTHPICFDICRFIFFSFPWRQLPMWFSRTWCDFCVWGCASREMWLSADWSENILLVLNWRVHWDSQVKQSHFRIFSLQNLMSSQRGCKNRCFFLFWGRLDNAACACGLDFFSGWLSQAGWQCL